MIDLKELSEMLDAALAAETTESLNKWFREQRGHYIPEQLSCPEELYFRSIQFGFEIENSNQVKIEIGQEFNTIKQESLFGFAA